MTGKKLIIHDLEEQAANRLLSVCTEENNWIVLGKEDFIRHCIGCFACWIKTPGQCVLKDKYSSMGSLLAKCDQVHIISRCCWGGPSPFVKNVLDRSISYIHPYFKDKNGEMHHRQRYDKTFDMMAVFYGESLSDNEKETAESWLRAAAINLYSNVKQIKFYSSEDEIEVHI